MFIVNVLGRAHVRGAKVWVTACFFLRRSGVMDFMRHMLPPAPLSALNRAEFEALLVELLGEIAALKQTVAELREENARLKGLKGRPNIKPSGMEKGTTPRPGNRGSRLAVARSRRGLQSSKR